jgi:hypothetical protein
VADEPKRSLEPSLAKLPAVSASQCGGHGDHFFFFAFGFGLIVVFSSKFEIWFL